MVGDLQKAPKQYFFRQGYQAAIRHFVVIIYLFLFIVIFFINFLLLDERWELVGCTAQVTFVWLLLLCLLLLLCCCCSYCCCYY
jgi:hypothetical protein